MNYRTLLACGSLIAAFCLLFGSTKTVVSVTPKADTVFTSTREITSLAVAPDGTLWVGTSGGILARNNEGRWQKFTRQEGLLSHETRRIVLEGDTVRAEFPQGAAVWKEGRWKQEQSLSLAKTADQKSKNSVESTEAQTCSVFWQGKECVATLTGLRLREETTWRTVPLPDSRGTHISALLPRGEMLWAALFGEGLWAFDGKAWTSVNIGLPSQVREITAMTTDGSTLWLGTRREGVWQYDGRNWNQYLQPEEPYNHNVQTFALFQNNLFVNSLEDGLSVRTPAGWTHVTPPLLSSVAPRQMVEFDGALYLRHGNGKVDRFDGKTWTRDVFAKLPRKQAMMIAADAKRLYVAQSNGWSEFDGKSWTHFLKLPEIQGCPITLLYPEGETLWIGTQNRGLAEFDHRTNAFRWHDERHGLPDDWITAIARVGKTLSIGTFVGGMAQWDGKHWTTTKELHGENVTALAPEDTGGFWIATRTGLWHQAASGKLPHKEVSADFLDTELQALQVVPGGLWVGARTGLFFLASRL